MPDAGAEVQDARGGPASAVVVPGRSSHPHDDAPRAVHGHLDVSARSTTRRGPVSVDRGSARRAEALEEASYGRGIVIQRDVKAQRSPAHAASVRASVRPPRRSIWRWRLPSQIARATETPATGVTVKAIPDKP